MNATACHYSIVRFLPFAETGEFSNVGVVLFAPAARRFCFQLLTRRVGRITAFFSDLDAAVVRAAVRSFETEMVRIADLFKATGTDRRLRSLDINEAMNLWAELVRPRETMMRFGETRVVMAAEPEAKLKELFEFYVERNFVTKEYQEQALDRAVRQLLTNVRLSDRFSPETVGNDEYHARFPFVDFGSATRPSKAIKPLHLAHTDASKIIDHGGAWLVRVNALRKRGLLPENVLFAVDGSLNDGTSQAGARQEIVDELRRMEVEVAPLRDREALVAFAAVGNVEGSHSRVSLRVPAEVTYWTSKLGISEQALRSAIGSPVGASSKAVVAPMLRVERDD